MKALEDNPNPSEKSLHIVPVGGLVVGSFLRLENELKTVIELWDIQDDEEGGEEERDERIENNEEEVPRKKGVVREGEGDSTGYRASRNSMESGEEADTEDDTNAGEFVSDGIFDLSPFPSHYLSLLCPCISFQFVSTRYLLPVHLFLFGTDATELHWAVCTGTIEKVNIALASPLSRSTINTPDSHGWTPLPMASVLGNWEICEALLNVDGILAYLGVCIAVLGDFYVA
jgi:hypothetical protein